jgi:hypothetical protein
MLVRLRLRTALAAVFVLTIALLPAGPAGAAPPVATGSDTGRSAIREIDLATNDLVYDPVHGVIVASIPSRVGAKGNSIVAIDPVTGRISPPIFVGSEPNKLALSRDASTLYVGLDGAAAIRVVDMTTLTAGLQFSLGSDPFTGPFYPEDIDVKPGAPDTVAVSRRNQGFSPRHEGVAIYQDGVQLPITTPDHTGSNVIEFSDSPGTLYGYNNETTEFGFRTMVVDALGVSVTKVVANLITGFGVDFEYDSGNDLAYATSGRVIDPANSVLMGTIAASGPVEPDSTNGFVFYVTGFSTLTLQAFDATTFVPRGSLSIPGASGSAGSLIRWGPRGLAFRTTGDQIFVISAGGLFGSAG